MDDKRALLPANYSVVHYTSDGKIIIPTSPEKVTIAFICDDRPIILYKRRWLMLAIFCLNSVLNGMLFFTFPPINDIISEYYDVRAAIVDMSAIMSYFASALIAIPFAFAVSAWGTRPTLMMGALLNIVAATLRYAGKHSGEFVYILVAQFIVGISFQCTLPLAARVATVWFGENERATATSIGGLVRLVGIAGSFLLSTQVVRYSDQRSILADEVKLLDTIYLLSTGAALIIVALFFKERPPTPSSRDPPDSGKVGSIREFFVSLKSLFRNKRYQCLAQAFAIYFALNETASIALNKMLTARFDRSYVPMIGWMGFANALTALPGTLLMGILLDKYKKYRQQAIVMNILSALTFIAFAGILWKAGETGISHDNVLFGSVFVLFTLWGLYGNPFVTTAMSHASVLTHPISEGTSGGIMMELGNIYTISLVSILGIFVNSGREEIACGILVTLYAAAAFFSRYTKTHLE